MPTNGQRVTVTGLFRVKRIVSKLTIAAVIVGALALLYHLFVFNVPTVHAQDDDATSSPEATLETEIVDSFEYTVQAGDYWSVVASRTGLSVATLQEANPTPTQRGYLRQGEVLTIPRPTATTVHIVGRGDSWSIVAQEYDISQQLLRAVNPAASRYGDVLRLNDTLVVPLLNEVVEAATPTPAVTATETAPDEPVTEEAPTTGDSSTADTDSEAVSGDAGQGDTDEGDTEGVDTDEAQTTGDEAEDAGEAAGFTPPPCPTDGAAYPAYLVDLLNATNGDVEVISTVLTDCGVMEQGVVANRDFTGDGIEDFVVVYSDPASTDGTTMDLVILDSATEAGTEEPYRIGHEARAESAVQLLSTADINEDTQPDVVWSEATCGAEDCFQTLQVYSWDGTDWTDWTAEQVILANADIRLEDVDEIASGFELLLDGGLYNGPDAGPQRARSVVWGSVDGAPYRVISEEIEESDCLYHWVIDGNAAFLQGASDNFAAAESYYSPAVADNTLVTCGGGPNEIDELRSYSVFRLAMIAAYRGQPAIASDLITGLSGSFPDSVYNQVGLAWLAGYQNNYDIAEGCTAVTAFAASNPQTVAILNEYGYANPEFTVADICPVLDDVDIPLLELPEVSTATTETVTITAAATTTVALTATAETTTTNTETATQESTADSGEAGLVEEDSTMETMEDGLPTCPENLAGFTTALPELLNISAGDPLIVETWLLYCDAAGDDESFALTDLNGDDREDAIFFPTIVSDRGVGPEGAQGAVLIYHNTGANGYELAYNPSIYGKPTLLTIEDLDDSGNTDIAWTVEGCATFCMSEVQMVNWQNGMYTTTIAPGATIAEGSARTTETDPGTPGQGKQLILEGGVSGTADGGLAVPHTEIWQSIDGAPFARIAWEYDRQVEESRCMGLRLVEADVAMQAADMIGYESAIALYTDSIDPSLAACSLYGEEADEELQLLQGLATFRLIQAHALAGETATAEEILAGLQRGLPESDYTEAAYRWLTSYIETPDAAAACETVAEIFTENTDLWQITDHFGYNHPALAAEQICYVP